MPKNNNSATQPDRPKPLMELYGSDAHYDNKWGSRKIRMYVYPEAVEFHRFSGVLDNYKGTHRMRYDQIASVLVDHGLLTTRFIVESYGGHTADMRISGRARRDADTAENLISKLIDETVQDAGSTSTENAESDILEQIRKLAELKDAGILSNEEFAAKKRDLLDRI